MTEVVIETERLILRPPRAEDLDGWEAFYQDEEAARFLGGVMPRAAAWRLFAVTAGCWWLQGYGMFSVIERSTGRWIGRLGAHTPEGWPGTEVGWSLLSDCWGKGYATEGAAAVMDWVFDHLGWTEVVHCIAPDNLASAKVARRLGSSLRGPGKLPPPLHDKPIDIWGQTREEWRARRASGK